MKRVALVELSDGFLLQIACRTGAVRPLLHVEFITILAVSVTIVWLLQTLLDVRMRSIRVFDWLYRLILVYKEKRTILKRYTGIEKKRPKESMFTHNYEWLSEVKLNMTIAGCKNSLTSLFAFKILS